ncbi:TolB-like translocation protein [Megalodesulfovibrio gigas]|uniref:Putative WD40-like Beta Propeller n=1 Tax=Megalodesulfovibrio gigas (strain ATCC 19364 / DSM 1382 / NCIMB 9332 / VKM B-1759) TaxID=1121448 RepID=T2GDI1_MEGG1|nr:hypothetical protein [Megalodesulfovibrio gigas]AGW14368.1 putative WD40-like Beta Propeller [Megalodesulfovibrio gigas DSM 1382 = ATCC 19364]
MKIRRVLLAAMAAMLLLVAALVGAAVAASSHSPLLFLRGQELWTADSQGQGQRRVAAGGVIDEWSPPALSPDGHWAVAVRADYSDETGLGRALVRIPLQGGQPAPLVLPDVHSVVDPSVSADGAAVVFVAAVNVRTTQEQMAVGDVAILRLDLATGSLQALHTVSEVFFDAGHSLAAPALSSDGARLAVQESGSDVSGGFFVLDREGKEVFRHPRDPEDYRPYWRPQFTPAGDAVLCYRLATDGSGQGDMLLVELRSGTERLLGQGLAPVFVDGGQAIVFERVRPGAEPDTTDLWRLDLTPGAQARMIVKDGRSPVSTPPAAQRP